MEINKLIKINYIQKYYIYKEIYNYLIDIIKIKILNIYNEMNRLFKIRTNFPYYKYLEKYEP